MSEMSGMSKIFHIIFKIIFFIYCFLNLCQNSPTSKTSQTFSFI